MIFKSIALVSLRNAGPQLCVVETCQYLLVNFF
jgi:hypothetical protein